MARLFRFAGVLPDSLARARKAVSDILENLPRGKVLVACSGGADSLALFFAAGFVAPKLGFELGAVIVDHGIHPDSHIVANNVSSKLSEYGVSLVEIVRVSVDLSQGEGLEGAARKVRYAALEEVADRFGAVAVLLGHTLDDQAETVLLGLARGSGGRSLSGMAVKRGVFVRPFLGITRLDTEDICVKALLDPWVDPANSDSSITRVRVRNEVLPMLRDTLDFGIVNALVRTASLLRDDSDYLDSLAFDSYRSMVVCSEDSSRVSLGVSEMLNLPKPIRWRSIRYAAADSCMGVLRYDHVSSIDSLLTSWRGQLAIHVPRGRVYRASGVLNFEKYSQ